MGEAKGKGRRPWLRNAGAAGTVAGSHEEGPARFVTTPRTAFWIALAAVVGLAASLRLPQLDLRPMHTDEAVQGVKFGKLLEDGEYRFNPSHYHGPTLYYFTLPVARVAGVNKAVDVEEWMLRLVPALFGIAAIGLLALFAPELGVGAILVAALFAAVSPGLVFYSRYYVQEALFYFFGLGMAGCAWRLYRNPSVVWAVATGLCVGLLHATKETCAINYAALSVAAVVVVSGTGGWANRRRAVRPLLVGAAVAAAVSVLFYSSFFTHARGSLDSILTFWHYSVLGGESGHEKPWWYYLRLLAWQPEGRGFVWSEGWLLFWIVAGLGAALWPRSGVATPERALRRGIAAYGLVQFAVYTWFGYKTPWLAFNFVLPLLLLAGDALIRTLRWIRFPILRVTVGLVCCLFTANLTVQAVRGCFRFPADTRNPYVYSHTTNNLVDLMDRVHELAALHSDGANLEVQVVGAEYWPIPWYLRDLPHAGYWNELPESLAAPLILVHEAQADAVEQALPSDYVPSLAGLRSGVHVILYVEPTLWRDFIDSR